MTWKAEDPEGNEAAKVKFDLIPYVTGRGIDIGCGPAKVFPHALGVDNLKDVRLFGIQMNPDIVADCTRLVLFADQSFDWVFSSHTLEHIEDHRAALAEWWRLLVPGGHLILYLPHRDLYPRIGEEGGNPDHKHDFANDDIVEAMTAVASDWTLLVNDKRDQGREYSFLQVYRKEAPGERQRDISQRPAPEKTAAVVRYGGYGDALWASSVLPHLKAEGYHVTVYTEKQGAEVLRADPHIDRLIVQESNILNDKEFLIFCELERRKYTRWINLTGSVETRLLPQPNEMQFYWDDATRRRLMDDNYLQTVHEFAGVPGVWRQKFYPTDAERARARERRAACDGPVIVVNPAGSTPPKWWPHAQAFMELMAKEGVHVFVVGDLRGQTLVPPAHYGHVVGTAWPIRDALALALEADIVIGTESAMVNAVAFEPLLKIVLLSHSSANNLTRDWLNTVTVEPKGLDCYPCHRVHQVWTHCVRDKDSRAAVCQAVASAATLAGVCREYLTALLGDKAA